MGDTVGLLKSLENASMSLGAELTVREVSPSGEYMHVEQKTPTPNGCRGSEPYWLKTKDVVLLRPRPTKPPTEAV